MVTERMIPLTGFLVNLASFFGRIKQTQSDGFVVDLNLRQPTVVFGAYARVTTFVGFAFLTVVGVFKIGRFAQIVDTVVRSIAVDMVYLVRGPFFGRVEPSQAMSEMQYVIKPDYDVTVFHPATRFSAGHTSPPFSVPSEHSRFRVVIDKLANAVCRNLVLHDTVNINHWRGCQP